MLGVHDDGTGARGLNLGTVSDAQVAMGELGAGSIV